METATISINGGREVPIKEFQEKLSGMLTEKAMDEYPNLKDFFAEVDKKEEEISEMGRRSMTALIPIVHQPAQIKMPLNWPISCLRQSTKTSRKPKPCSLNMTKWLNC